MPNAQSDPAEKSSAGEEKPSASDLRKASSDLKLKIAEAKARNDMPFDSTLGNPNWDKNAADGHLDVADDDDDGWPPLPVKANKTSPP